MSETLKLKLLTETDFDDYARAIKAPPAVPKNWKPALFSNGQPWGTLHDAAALLAAGKVNEGRELLQRLAKHKENPAARAMLAHELTRPPEDLKLARTHVFQLPVDSSEHNALIAARSFMNRDFDVAASHLLKAMDRQPVSVFGCAILFRAFLWSADFQIKNRLLLPRGRQIESVTVTYPLKGIAQLDMRMHRQAWETFKLGWLQANEGVNNYERSLALALTQDERAYVEMTLSMMCAAGLGLILFDLGLRREATEVFAALAADLVGTIQYAARTLAQY